MDFSFFKCPVEVHLTGFLEKKERGPRENLRQMTGSSAGRRGLGRDLQARPPPRSLESPVAGAPKRRPRDDRANKPQAASAH